MEWEQHDHERFQRRLESYKLPVSYPDQHEPEEDKIQFGEYSFSERKCVHSRLYHEIQQHAGKYR